MTFVAAFAVSVAPACAADADLKAGARVYEENCEACHGEGLRNYSGVSFDLRRLHADEHDRFVNSVLNGKNAMPAWRGALNAGDIERLWVYIRAHAYDAGAK
jgi:cytochrome c5